MIGKEIGMNSAGTWAATLIAALALFAAPAVAAQADVTVIRGTMSDAAAEQAAGGLPTVLRGWRAGAPRPAATPEPEPGPTSWIAAGGDTLWLVERNGGRVIGCWLQGSGRVGVSNVRCGQGAWR